MINPFSTFKVSFRALRVNKMRSALTMLGIIIGVSAVIIMLAVGTGASRKMSDFIESIGSNIIMVLPGATTAGGVRMGAGTQSTLTLQDAEAIERECSAVAGVAPALNGGAQTVFGRQNWSTIITGTTPNMLIGRDWRVVSGRPFSEQEVRSAAKVCLLGQTVANNLFGDIDPVDKMIRIKRVPFRVVGILEPKGQSPSGQDQDDTIFVPVTTAQRKLFGSMVSGMVGIIYVKAKSAEEMPVAEKQITELLRQRHHTHAGQKQENDFTVRNLTEILEASAKATQMMTFLLAAIASISLLVGGIGIMNIMLVSVTERTREIGIRMAVGAKTWDIRVQFILEALTLSLSGGVVGMILGVSASQLFSHFSGFPMVITPAAVMLSFAFSGLVGAFFGFYPAYRASLLSPIDALRYE
ncbi:MAG TPA: ABC transporter permease [Thermodesulfovibrionales bacterium]|nr:ABC transporter permease [Thermodesulfovibrionales bacterium]